MNTDFRLSVGYFEHPKVLKLERRLGEGAVLAHIRLLRFTTMNKPDGILSGMDSEDIAIAAGYKGDPDPFITLLLTLRLIDQEDGEYSLHDWAEWNPWAAGSKNRTDKARVAAATRWGHTLKQTAPESFSIAKPIKPVAPSIDNNATSNATSIDEHCSNTGLAMPLSYPILSYPILSPPILSPPILSKEDKSAALPLPEPLPKKAPVTGDKNKQSQITAFAEFYAIYPVKRARQDAEKAWLKISPNAVLRDTIMTGLANAKNSEEWQEDSGRYIPHPATFLNHCRWEDDYTPAGSRAPAVRTASGTSYLNGGPTLFRSSQPSLSPEDRRDRTKAWITEETL